MLIQQALVQGLCLPQNEHRSKCYFLSVVQHFTVVGSNCSFGVSKYFCLVLDLRKIKAIFSL